VLVPEKTGSTTTGMPFVSVQAARSSACENRRDIHTPCSGRFCPLFEKILSGAAPMAPLLFPNLVVLGWIALAAMMLAPQDGRRG